MNPGNQLLEVGPAWNEVRIKFAVAREYDLGKFLFTVASGTIGFLFTAEKIETNAALDAPLTTAFVFLLIALALSVWMAMTAPPDSPNATFGDIHRITNRKVWAWLALWVLGTGFGVYAVI